VANNALGGTVGQIGIGVGSAIVGGAVGYLAGRRSSRTKTRKRRRSSNKTRRKRNRVYRRKKQKRPYTAGKRKDTSRRRIRYTKNNQPYVIMANGRARFISKRSVSSSRKRKGGKY
jgi:Flp pilus assembly protein TadB